MNFHSLRRASSSAAAGRTLTVGGAGGIMKRSFGKREHQLRYLRLFSSALIGRSSRGEEQPRCLKWCWRFKSENRREKRATGNGLGKVFTWILENCSKHKETGQRSPLPTGSCTHGNNDRSINVPTSVALEKNRSRVVSFLTRT